MEGTVFPVPTTVDEAFLDFKGRRAGMIKAFTTDLQEFYQQCDPNPERGTLCLYGFPDETWKVDLPVEEVPSLPQPVVGINLIRDDMEPNKWLSHVLILSDAWLISVAFFFGLQLGFSKSERRRRLFQMINELPTVFEAVAGALKQAREEASVQKNGSKNKSSGRMPSRQPEPQSKDEDKSEGDEEEEEAIVSRFAAMSVKNGSMGNA